MNKNGQKKLISRGLDVLLLKVMIKLLINPTLAVYFVRIGLILKILKSLETS